MTDAPIRRGPGRPRRIQPTFDQAAPSVAKAFEAQSQVEAPSVQDDTPSLRPEPRPAMRAEDPRERAARRAAELRDHGALNEEAVDKYAIPRDMIPDGWDYEWKRRTVYGKEDPSYQVSIARAGWEEVPADRHPSFMPKGWNGSTIERDGLVLMERPKEISDEARRRDQRNARLQVQQKEAELNGAPAGTLPRDQDARTKARINKGWESMPVPE